MTKHLSHDQRRESILISAMSIFCDSGLDAINMSTLSRRTRVSRQALYGHFRNVDEVLEALFDQTFDRYYDALRPMDPFAEMVRDHPSVHRDGILELPDAVRRLGALAFYSGPYARPFLARFKERFDALLEHHWVAPLVETGIERPQAASHVYTLMATAFSCGDLMDRGAISRHDANAQLDLMTDLKFRIPTRPIMSLVN